MSIKDLVKIAVRPARVDEAPIVREWLEANKERNAYDASVLDYPACQTFAAHTNGTVFAYLPVQQVSMLESAAINPDATPREAASGLAELVKAIKNISFGAGMGETYFLVSDEATAEAAKYFGFEEVKCRVMRAKLR